MWQKENSMENERAIGYGTYERLYVLREKAGESSVQVQRTAWHAVMQYVQRMLISTPFKWEFFTPLVSNREE